MKPSLSLRTANILYLASMLLVITAGSFIQTLNLSMGLIATETLLILLPALLLLRARGIPFRSGLRLNPIRPVIGLICLLLGISVYLFSTYIEVWMMALTGRPSVPLPSGALPQGWLPAILYFIALAAAAPVCEEVLFRGAFQGAYEERRSPRFAIILTALLFAIYHFRLSGLPGLLPVAFILGFAAWRTQSIYASMLIHVGMNGASAAVTLAALNGSPLPGQLFGSLLPFAAGLAAAGGLLYALMRIQPALTSPRPMPELIPRLSFRGRAATYWPLACALALYLGVAAMTLAIDPDEAGASTQLNYYPTRIDTAIHSRYQATNRAGIAVGEMGCTVAPLNSKFSLDCTSAIQAYEVKQASSYFSDTDHTTALKVVWDTQTFQVLEYSFERLNANGSGHKSQLQDGWLITSTAGDLNRIPLSGTYLLEYEWLWHVNNLNGDPGSAFKVPYAYLLRWDETLKKSVPALRTEILREYPAQTLNLPAGSFEAWKVTLANRTAWYGRNDKSYPRPIKFDDGMLIYELTE